MKEKRLAIILAVVCASLFIEATHAEEKMDVDLADSPNFESFHKDKKDAVKIWSSEKGFGIQSNTETEKVYENESQTKTEPTNVDQRPASTTGLASTSKTGKHYEIRELYSIGGSERTGYTPTTVVQALFLQMQGLCPKGWRKLDERSEPDGDDAFYMYYSFECL